MDPGCRPPQRRRRECDELLADLSSMCAIVAGGASGIGPIAVSLVRAGSDVVVNSRTAGWIERDGWAAYRVVSWPRGRNRL